MDQSWKSDNHQRIVEQQLSQINMTTQFMNSRQLLEQSMRTSGTGGGVRIDTPVKAAVLAGVLACILPILGIAYSTWGAWYVGVVLIAVYLGIVWLAYSTKKKRIEALQIEREHRRLSEEQKAEDEQQRKKEETQAREETEAKEFAEFVLLAEEFRRLVGQQLETLEHEALFIKALGFVVQRRNHPLKIGLPLRESMTKGIASEVGILMWHLNRIVDVYGLSNISDRFSSTSEYITFYQHYLVGLIRKLDFFGTIVTEGFAPTQKPLLSGKRNAS